MLLVRVFAVDPRLKPDLLAWKSSQQLPCDFHQSFLEQLVSLSHSYLRSKLTDTFALVQSLILAVSKDTDKVENEVASVPLTDAQLRQIIDFKLRQAYGQTNKPPEKSEGLQQTFEQKYKKLVAQQHTFSLERESEEFVRRFCNRKKTENVAKPPETDQSSEEDESGAVLRKVATSAVLQPAALLPKLSSHSSRPARFDSPTLSDHANSRKSSLKPPSNSRFLPIIHSKTHRLLPKATARRVIY